MTGQKEGKRFVCKDKEYELLRQKEIGWVVAHSTCWRTLKNMIQCWWTGDPPGEGVMKQGEQLQEWELERDLNSEEEKKVNLKLPILRRYRVG